MKTPGAQDIEKWLLNKVSECSGFAREELDPCEPFDNWGVSSREAVTLSGDLEEWLGRTLPPTLLWEYPTPRALSQHLAAQAPGAAGKTEAPVPAQAEPAQDSAIAIIGVACRLPGASSPAELWKLLDEGRDAIGKAPAGRWRPGEERFQAALSSREGGFVEGIERFDAPFFSVSPREAAGMDPQQRMLLEVAWEAWESAGIVPGAMAGSKTGVFIGASGNDYSRLHAREGLAPDIYMGTGNASSIIANRLSYFFDLRGPSLSVDTACSSSLVSVHLACRSLAQGECEVALAGGVNAILSADVTAAFAQAHMLAADGRCKTFDARADGYVRSEGCGVLVLKRLSKALADGDTIWAVIRGSAVNQDGRTNGLTAPNGLSQQAVIREALATAGLSAHQIDYVEAHGTGTPLGDPIEVDALKAVFLPERPEQRTLWVGSVKSQIGHLESAAGVAGLLKVILSLRNGRIPRQLHLSELNPHIHVGGTALRFPTEACVWPERQGAPRRAGVSSFGFGGTNSHVIVESAPAAPSTPAQGPEALERPLHVLALSARTPGALRATVRAYQDAVKSTKAGLADLCFSANTGRTHFPLRVALAAGDGDGMARMLEEWLKSGEARSRTAPGRLAFAFAGQGSQYANMGRQLHETQPLFRRLLSECDAITREHFQLSLLEMLYAAEPDARLNETAYTQLALFAVEIALARLWQSWGIVPEAVIGHSVGEYTAACVAGAFTLEEGLLLVGHRGRLMQGICTRGAMAVIHAEEARVLPLLERWSGRLTLAAVNSPGNLTLAGDQDALTGMLEALEAQGIQARPLKVSHAFHSHHMDPILESFEAEVRRLTPRALTLPLASNVSGRLLEAGQVLDAAYWRTHLRSPVRLYEGVRTLLERGFDTFVEVGPQPMLAPLAADYAAPHALWLPSLSRRMPDWRQLSESVAALYERGAHIDWRGFEQGYPRQRCELPTYPFEREVHWFQGASRPATPAPMTSPAVSPEVPMRATTSDDQVLEVLRGIVAGALQSRPEAVDVHRSLLEMGADSLILLEFTQRLEKTFGVKVPLRQLFDDLSTLDALARHVAREMPTDWSARLQAMPPATSAAAPAPVAAAPAPVALPAPTSIASGTPSSFLEQVVSQQLALMSQQLELLRGAPAAQAVSRAAELPAPAPAPEKRKAPAHLYQVHHEAPPPLEETQRRYLQKFVDAYTQRTRGSKEAARASRGLLVDKRSAIVFRPELKELCYTVVGARTEGSRLWDVDGNEYIDISMGFGVELFGHAPPFIQRALEEQLARGVHLGPSPEQAGDVARLIHELTGAERITFCTSGTEAVMTAVRLARAVTGREKIAIFTGAYHGHSDVTLAVAAGRDAALSSFPMSPGIPQATADAVMVLEYGNPRSLEVLKAHAHELAAVLVEPVQSRRPDLQPREFIHACRQLTRESGSLLILDEVITGFRLHPRGAQAWFGVDADLVVYGKIAGGGLPLGVVAGPRALIDRLDGGAWSFGDDSAPHGQVVYFAGTFARHPLTLAAAKAALTHLKEQGPSLHEQLNQRTERFARQLNHYFEQRGLALRIAHCGSVFRFTLSGNFSYLYPPLGLDLFFYHLLHHGVYIWEGRSCFLSTAHSDEDLQRVAAAVRASAEALLEAGFLRATPAVEAPAPVRAEPAAPQRLALTEAQHLLWLASQMSEEGNLVYRISACLELKGALRMDALEQAVKALVTRHESLRTVIDRLGTHQEVRASMPVELVLTEASRLSASDEAGAVREWLERDAVRPFSLPEGPLLRVQVLRLEPARHQLLLSAHHIVVDGWSLGTLLMELFGFYTDACAGRPLEVTAAVPFQALLQAARNNEEALGQHERYWLERFATPITRLELPTDLPRPEHTRYLGQRHGVLLPLSVSRALKQLCGREGSTVFMTLFAVYAAMLHRLTQQEDVVIGIPVADRDVEGGAGIVGHCTNLLAIRSRLARGASFPEFLRSLKPALVGAFEHRSYPFARLLQRLRTLGRLPEGEVIRTTFNLEHRMEPPRTPGLDVRFTPQPARYSPFELSLNATELEDGLLLELDSSSELFTADTARGILACYQTLLTAILEQSGRPLRQLPLLSEQELQARVAASGATASALPSVHALFEAGVRRHPDACALTEGSRRLTYRELNERANQVAHTLLARGIQPEQPVGLFVERSAGMLVGLLGILKAGAAYVPFDAASPAKRLEMLLSETGVRMVLTQESLRERLPAATVALCLEEGDTSPFAQASRENPPARGAGGQLAYIMYTSGSTGRPKGVMVTHEGLSHYVTWAVDAYRIAEGGGAPLHGSLAFDATLTSIFPPLVAGQQIVVMAEQAPLDSLATALQGRPGWSVLKITPAHLKALEPLLPVPTLSGGVRTVVIGGEALSSATLAPWVERSPGVTFVNEYGPTETVVGCCIHSVTQGDALPGNIPIGKPPAYTSLYLLDEGLQHVPDGVVGELYIGGAAVARGYFGRPDLTAVSFVPDPWSRTPGARLYKTGDLARRLPDGTFVFLGRRDAQVKIRGFRVELEEIQARLSTHPAVGACHIGTRTDASGEAALVAYIVPRDAAPPSPEELARHLAETLPAYMVPTHHLFLPALPLTENGKVDQRALPAPLPPERKAGGRAPESATEKALAALWSRLLDVTHVDAESDFFALGGHSLSAGQLVARIRESLGTELPIRAIFEAPVLSQMARRIDQQKGTPDAAAPGRIQRQPRTAQRVTPAGKTDNKGGHHG
jgi:glutamate-1-semialdehyde-2,1-aminomutase